MSKSESLKRIVDERRKRLPQPGYPPALPIMKKRAEIAAAVQKHPVIIVAGETGSGKTTQIPKMCLEAGRGLAGMIGCTQPRRIAATTVARRIAEEFGEELGQSVGYKIRFDDHTPKNAFIKIMTDGILLMEAQADPLLRAYDTVIVDEAHERSLNIDFILGILKNILIRRNDLRVIITSATIDTEKFSRAFNDAPVIEVSGRLFPVEVRYEPSDRHLVENGDISHIDAAVSAVERLTGLNRKGDILIFMPTEQDIRETRELLNGRFREEVDILPLYSKLSRFDQERVFKPSRHRKIVIATNVAETSLTIPGIRYVIDTGLARISQYNPRSRTAGLPVRTISRSSADQRKGRCGRVENGVCIRLYDEDDYLGRPLYTPPEILRSNLAGVILRMLSLGLENVDAFPFIDKPAPKSIKDGIDILQELGAIAREENTEQHKASPWQLTEMGRIMARLPVDPRLSRMIIEAKKEGCLEDILIIAAALSVQEPRERPVDREAEADRVHATFKDPASDFVTRLKIWQRCYGPSDSAKTQSAIRRYCREKFLSYRRMREWRDVHEQLRKILAEQKFLPAKRDVLRLEGADLYTAIHRSVLSGYLGHIAVKKEKNIYTATHGRQAMIFPGSGLFNRAGNWIVAAEMVETSRLFAKMAANIDSAWLEELGGTLCRSAYFIPHWEKSRGEVVATEQVSLFGLVIVPGRTVAYGRIDPVEASRIFIRSALVDGEVTPPLPFLVHNHKVIEKIAGMEEKLRRRGFLVDDEEMARFYEERLPGICDVRTLRRLVRDKGDDAFLRMREEDLLARQPDSNEIELFPEKVSAGGWSLECVYRFDPGDSTDGITLKIPAQAAHSISPDALEWAVPGLLRDKIAALLRGLPKGIRKKLMPLNETSEIILKEMPREGSLVTALGNFLYKRFAVNIPADLWPSDGLDDHLKLRFSVVDGKDRELVAGRDISVLEGISSDEEESPAFAKARIAWEKRGITKWDFGDLPDTIYLQNDHMRQEIAYPALAADENGVHLRLFRSAPEALRNHFRGVRALLTIFFRDELRHLRKGLAPTGDLKLWAASFGGVKVLENALYEKVTHDLFEKDVRTADNFANHAENVKPLILPKGQELLKAVRPVLKGLYEVTELFRALDAANHENRPFLDYLDMLRGELAALIPADIFIRFDEERISHICRYMRALAVRAERAAVHLEKAISRMVEIHEIAERYGRIGEELPSYATEEKRKALEDYGWLIEEYKVSVFAQELKTPFPVSRKRLDAKIAEIERML